MNIISIHVVPNNIMIQGFRRGVIKFFLNVKKLISLKQHVKEKAHQCSVQLGNVFILYQAV